MRVRYLVSEAGLTWSREPGEIYDLPDAEAKAALESGKAELPKEEGAAEAAVVIPRENAARPHPRGRRV